MALNIKYKSKFTRSVQTTFSFEEDSLKMFRLCFLSVVYICSNTLINLG